MTIIKIEPHDNGGHDNQTMNGVTPETFPIPDGWAVVPEIMLPLENFPFGKVESAMSAGNPVVTSWTPLPMPEPEPVPAEPQYTELQLLGQQVTDLELMVLEGRENRV